MPLQVINHPTGKETLTLSEYKDKLIILDFWATWCAPCIKSLTKLDTLQKEFGEQLAVIPVTYENSDKVQPFLTKRGYQLPSVINDSTLKKYFPHRSIPHQVWVRDGEVLAVTGAEYGTRENITKALNKQQVQMLMKEEDMEFTRRKPLLIDGNGGGMKNLLYQSVISKRVNVRSGGYEFCNGGITVMNAQVAGLFSTAYQTAITNTNIWYRIKIEVEEPLRSRVSMPKGGIGDEGQLQKWREENTFCYGLAADEQLSRDQIYEKMRHDLNFYFKTHWQITAGIESREVPCFVIGVADPDKARLHYTAGGVKAIEIKEDSFCLENQTLWPVANSLMDNHDFGMPLVVDNAITEKFDLKLSSGPKDLKRIKEELGRHGLEIKERKMEIELLVIKPAAE